MNLNEALGRLRSFNVPVVRTNDAAALWGVKPALASKMLSRLSCNGHATRLQRGIWLLENVHPWTLHPYLTDPSPSYISLQTALFHHGMIEQIPPLIHVISTFKTRVLKTAVGVFIIHQVVPEFFCGYEPLSSSSAQVAIPEKALVDFFYLRQTKSRNFRVLPELELPKTFSIRKAKAFAALIPYKSRRTLVENMLDEL